MLTSARRFVLLCAIALVPAAAFTQSAGMKLVEVTPDQLKWAPNANGTTQAVLYGDPTKDGLYVIQVKFPKGLKLTPHSHPDERIVTVLSGTAHFGLGEQFDEKKLKALPPESMWTEPAKQPHFAWAMDGEVVLQIVGHGPTSATAVGGK